MKTANRRIALLTAPYFSTQVKNDQIDAYLVVVDLDTSEVFTLKTIAWWIAEALLEMCLDDLLLYRFEATKTDAGFDVQWLGRLSPAEREAIDKESKKRFEDGTIPPETAEDMAAEGIQKKMGISRPRNMPPVTSVRIEGNRAVEIELHYGRKLNEKNAIFCNAS